MDKLVIYADNLDGAIGVSIGKPSFKYKYMHEVTEEVQIKAIAILSLDDGQFGPARELLKKHYGKNM